MKKSVFAALTAVIMLGVSVWLWHNRTTRIAWDTQYQSTFFSFRRMAEYKDAGTLLYEPRRLDFEQHLDALKLQPTPYYGSMDSRVRESMIADLRGCGDAVSFYREFLDDFNSAESKDEPNVMQLALKDMQDESVPILKCAGPGSF